MNLGEKLSAIQCELKVKKSKFNRFGKYNFRSAEDILEALKPFNEKYKVFFTITEELIEPGILRSIAKIHDCEVVKDGDHKTIESPAIVGVDLNQKGMQVPQQYGSASSYGKKYALGNLLLIDDTETDSDVINTHEENPLPKPTEQQWSKIKQKIKSETATIDQVKANFSLTPEQEKEIS